MEEFLMVNPYCISGAGSSQANGTYSYNSSIDTWQKVGDTSVYFNYDYDYDCFRLIDGNMGYYPLYAGTLYQTNPSLITWSTIYGTSPVPTITAGECEVVLVDPYCVSGAGDSIANGTYSFVNSSYNQFMSGYWQHTTEPNLRMGQGMMGSYEIYNEYTRLYYASSLTGTWTVEYGTASAPTVTAGACGATSAPTVTSISPDTGTTAGGTNITITGTNLTGATAVTIGGTAVTSFTVVSSTSITAATPAKTAGTASVLVTTPGGTNAANTLFTYSAPSVVPTVTSISPTSGTTAGGTSITITGTNFTGATGVTIGGTAATNVTVVSSTSITATTPSGTAGAKSVLVTTAEGTNTANTLFTFTAPSPTPSPTTSNIIKPRRSEVAGVIPLPSELQTHEMAVNLADKIIFVKKSDDTIVAINGSSGGGGSTLIVGVDVQGYDADLQAISDIASGTGLLKKTGTTWSLDSSAYLTSSSTIDADTLNAQLPSYYLNYTNLTNKPTIISSVSATTPIVANTVSGSTSLSIPAATTAAAGHMSAAQVTSLNSLSTSVSTLTASTVQSRFYASPSTVTGTPTFRSIVASDIPTLNQNTTGSSGSCTGTSANVTGLVAVSNGGTGVTIKTGTGKVVLSDAPVLKGQTESLSTAAISSGILNLNCSNGTVFSVNLNSNISTVNFTNVSQESGSVTGITVIFLSTVVSTISWPSNLKWATTSNSPPALSSTINKKDIFIFLTYDLGQNWIGFVAGQNV